MAYPVIIFNASTGSDTAASGAGPSTALAGSDASTDGTGLIATLPNQNLDNVAIDGSHALWIDTASGRQWSKITGKADSGSATANVTVANAYSTGLTGQTFGLGGKRATFNNTDSRKLFTADLLPNWIAETETDQTISSTNIVIIASTTDGPITIRGSGGRRAFIQSSNAGFITVGDYTIVHGFRFYCTNATRTLAGVIGLRGGGIRIYDNIFGDATNTISSVINRISSTPNCLFFDNEVKYATHASGPIQLGSMSAVRVIGNWIHHCTAHAINPGTCNGPMIIGNLITDNGEGILMTDTQARNCLIMDNTIDGNTGDGIDVSTDQDTGDAMEVIGNIISNNGGYGFRGPATETGLAYSNNNNYYNNTSGSRLNIIAGEYDLAVDPQFIDRSGNNYGIGENLKAKGWVTASQTIGAGQSATISYRDIGASQREERSRLAVLRRN
jgi:parallel beta-helix repeat protein